MHKYNELMQRAVTLELYTLTQINDDIIDKLQSSAETILIKSLQVIRYKKAIFATGLFSMFEAHTGMKFNDIFATLKKNGYTELTDRAQLYYYAINVLKHGEGPSYRAIISHNGELPFRVLKPQDYFFDEGDVSEISILIDVDDDFVANCLDIILKVSDALSSRRDGTPCTTPP